MKAADLDTKEVPVTRTEKRYVLNEKVFDLDECPDWAQYAAVDADGTAWWYYGAIPRCSSIEWVGSINSMLRVHPDMLFDATDWQHSLIRRPQKVLEVTMAELEKEYGCKVKIVREK